VDLVGTKCPARAQEKLVHSLAVCGGFTFSRMVMVNFREIKHLRGPFIHPFIHSMLLDVTEH
jgi:hypothetical protein